MNDELAALDATAQADLVRSREVTPRELVEAAISRIEAVDGKLNAVVSPLFDEALSASGDPRLPDGPFRGVPIVFKDLGGVQEGMPLYEGNRVLREIDFRARADTPVGARIRDAGFIAVAKTATPEFGAQPTTQPLAFGPTHNPWDTSRSTSGSSGGSGAAVASGMVPIAHATDGGGSIRQPASWCGLVGLKPSRGRMPRGPLISRLSTEGVLTRSVRDTAAALDALQGAAPSDLYRLEAPERPYLEEVGADPDKLRIGKVTSVEASGVETHPDAVAAVEDAARLLESLGHAVEDSSPERLFDDEFLLIAEKDYASMMIFSIEAFWRVIGRRLVPEDLEPYTWARMERVRGLSGSEYVAAASWLQRYSHRIISWWQEGFDLLVTPSTGEPPALLDELVPRGDDPFEIDHRRFSRIRCFVRPFNVTGNPGISLPLYWTQDGLPVGVQLVADLGREDLLIRVASQLEEARPWAHRHPPVFAG